MYTATDRTTDLEATHPPASGKLDVIQVLRGLAALMVVAYHGVGYQTSKVEPGITKLIFDVGKSGVDLFFLISGFIMVYSTRNARGGLHETVEFLIKRMSRIWPVYAIATLVYLPMMIIMGLYVGHIDIMTSPAQVARSIVMLPTNFAWPAPYFGGSVLHVGWTINYEAYFYALFALSLFFGRWRWLAYSLIIGTMLIVVPTLRSHPSLDAYVDYGFHGPLNYFANPMLWEFVLGSIIGLVYLSPLKLPSLAANLFSLFALSVLLWFLIAGVSNKLGFTGWAGPYALLLFALTIGSKTMTVRWPQSLVWIGNVSFSLYLVHPFVIHPAYQLVWDRLMSSAIMNNVWYMGMIAAASLALAAVSYHYLERGASEWVRRHLLTAYRKRSGARSKPLQTS